MAKLEVSVGINNAGFKAGLDEMRAGVARFKGSLASMSGSALGSIFAVGSIVAFTRGVLQAAGAIDDLASRHGVSRQALQQWKDAVEQNGSSLETLSSSLNKLELAQTKALKGDEGLTKSFAELGITIDDLLSKSPDQLLMKIGKGSMEADAMVKVLGKSALELRDALQDAAENGLGDVVTMSDRTVKVFASLDDGLSRLGATAKNFIANGLADFFIHLQKEGAGLLALFDQVANGASGAVEIVGKLMSGDKMGAATAFQKMKENAKEIHEQLKQDKADIGAKYSGKDEGSGKETGTNEAKEEAAEAQKREDRLQKIREAEADAAREASKASRKSMPCWRSETACWKSISPPRMETRVWMHWRRPSVCSASLSRSRSDRTATRRSALRTLRSKRKTMPKKSPNAKSASPQLERMKRRRVKTTRFPR